MEPNKEIQHLNMLYMSFKDNFTLHYGDKISFQDFEFFCSSLSYFLNQKSIGIESKSFHLLTISIIQHQLIEEIKHLVRLQKHTSSHFNHEFLELFLEKHKDVIEELEIKLSAQSCLLIKHIHNIRFQLFSAEDFDPIPHIELLQEVCEYTKFIVEEYDTFLSQKINDLFLQNEKDSPKTQQHTYLG